MNSERLPGKVLRILAGRALLHHVYARARGCSLLDEIFVATDAEAVRDYCVEHRIPVRMTASSHRSGTERIHEVMQSVAADVYLNLQADEPLVTADHVRLLIEPFRSRKTTQVSTLKVALDSAEAGNPNVVKVVTDAEGQALYFSRSPIPYQRDFTGPPLLFKHLGLYGYRSSALEAYVRLAPTPLELVERLEQLRFLENRIPIQVAETDQDTIGVDTEQDWMAVCRLLEGASGNSGR
jgi:3-deoxy-manno-octulosonate cytidylyltransferase (CMP-KDO synthetase)